MTEYIAYHGVADPNESLNKPGIYNWNGSYHLVDLSACSWYLCATGGVTIPIEGKSVVEFDKPELAEKKDEGSVSEMTLLKALAIAQDASLSKELLK